MLETQNINVAACLFYARCGFVLGGYDRFLYRGLTPETDEIALYWYLIFDTLSLARGLLVTDTSAPIDEEVAQ